MLLTLLKSALIILTLYNQNTFWNTYLWYHKLKCTSVSCCILTCILSTPLETIPPPFLKVPLETCHVLTSTLFFKFSFGSSNFLMEKIWVGFHLLLDCQLNQGAGSYMNSSLSVHPAVYYTVFFVLPRYFFLIF